MKNRFELIASVAVGAIIAYLFYPTLKEIALICWEDEDYSHGLLLPVISGYVLKSRLEDHKGFRPSSGISILGVLLVLFGGALLLVGNISNILFPAWVGFFPVVIGCMFLAIGFQNSLLFIPPVLLLFMAKPIPDSLVPRLFWPLQVMAAKISGWVLRQLDVPVYLLGNIIEIPGMKLMVEEACSGIRSLMALVSVALIVILIVPMKRSAQLGIFALSIATAVALNVVRVALTGILAYFYDPSAATGFFHTFSGLVVFALGLAIVYGAASLVSQPKRAL